MSDYPLIADHGLIGDLQTAALVATDGSIDWFCAPRFDSPSIFGALLDHTRGGYFRARPTADVVTSKQLYFPDTAVLVTRFMTEEGVGEVVDFMPVSASAAPTGRHRLVRMLRCVRGQITFAVEIAPRFDYGRESHEAHVSDDGVVFRGARTVDDRSPRPGAGGRAPGRGDGGRGGGRARPRHAHGGHGPRHRPRDGGHRGAGRCGWPRSSSSSTRPCASGSPGWRSPPTSAAGARRFTAPPSPSSS